MTTVFKGDGGKRGRITESALMLVRFEMEEKRFGVCERQSHEAFPWAFKILLACLQLRLKGLGNRELV
jgi:hypothetical protein